MVAVGPRDLPSWKEKRALRGPFAEQTAWFEVVFEIKNWGRTPAQITDVQSDRSVLDFGSPLAADPVIPYREGAGEVPDSVDLVK